MIGVQSLYQKSYICMDCMATCVGVPWFHMPGGRVPAVPAVPAVPDRVSASIWQWRSEPQTHCAWLWLIYTKGSLCSCVVCYNCAQSCGY